MSPKTRENIQEIGLAVLGVILIFYGAYALKNTIDTSDWLQTPGQITRARVNTQGELASKNEVQVSGSKRRALDIRYSYKIGEKQYSGTRISFGQATSPKLLLAKYREGSQVTVWVNPEHPKLAVLEKGTSKKGFILITLGLLLAVPVVVSQIRGSMVEQYPA